MQAPGIVRRVFLLCLMSVGLNAAWARADGPASVADSIARLDAELARAAPDAAARGLAGHAYRDASRALAQAHQLVDRARADEVRHLLPVLELRVRMVAMTVDSGRLLAMARERERRALLLAEEARVARAAFEQAVERRLALEAEPTAPAGSAAGQPAAGPSSPPEATP